MEENNNYKNKKRKDMVRTYSAAALIALALGLSAGLTSCASAENPSICSCSEKTESSNVSSSSPSSSSTHTHDYGNTWKYNETKHWHECATDGVKSDEADHIFTTDKVIITEATATKTGVKAYKCTVCGYHKGDEEYTPYISNEEFLSGLKFDGDKYTVDCVIAETGKENETASQVKNGNIVHYVSTGSASADLYYTKDVDGDSTKYYEYSKDSNGTWIKNEVTNKYYDAYKTFDANKSCFDDSLTYDKLAFDAAIDGYTGKYSNEQGTEINVKLYFVEAKLAKAVKTYSGKTYTYTFLADAETINLPTNPHAHNVTSGVLDLNASIGSDVRLKGTCSECNQEVTVLYGSDKTITSVEYGYYPQSHVSDASTISSLDALTSADTTSGWYLLNGTYYSKKTLDTRYGRVTFKDGTEAKDDDECWFKCEPIKWNILASRNGKYSLVSSVLLDAQAYRSGIRDTTYKTSDIRTWLNGYFHDSAFSSHDSYLEEVNVLNSALTTDLLTNGDKVYLLSNEDYCNTDIFADNAARACEETDYTSACYTYSGYWTRTGYSGNYGYVIDTTGETGSYSYDTAFTYCIRPGITIRIS